MIVYVIVLNIVLYEVVLFSVTSLNENINSKQCMCWALPKSAYLQPGENLYLKWRRKLGKSWTFMCIEQVWVISSQIIDLDTFGCSLTVLQALLNSLLSILTIKEHE